MSMTIQSSVKDKILTTPSETSKVENAPAEMLRKANVVVDALSRKERVKPRHVRAMTMTIQSGEWNSGDDQLRLRWMIYLVVLADVAESVSDTIGFDYKLSIRCALFKALYGRKRRSPVSLIGPELVLETTDKVVLIKENLKAVRGRQKLEEGYADTRLKP
ncbi:hypothetical protein Tco_0212188 [Tanacetum coccineum]